MAGTQGINAQGGPVGFMMVDKRWSVLVMRCIGLIFMLIPVSMAVFTIYGFATVGPYSLGNLATVLGVILFMGLGASVGATMFGLPMQRTTFDTNGRTITVQRDGPWSHATFSVPFAEVVSVGELIKSGGKGGPVRRPALYLTGDRKLYVVTTGMSRRQVEVAVAELAAVLGVSTVPPTGEYGSML